MLTSGSLNKPAQTDYTAMTSSPSTQDIAQRWPAQNLLDANLHALRQRNAELADCLAHVSLPVDESETNGVQITEARDGSVTFRCRRDDGKWNWLGYSSTPLLSGRANAKRIKFEQGNLAMNGIGHGVEAEYILNMFGGHQALFIIESNLLHFNLALRLRDFTESLANGRLVFITAPDPCAGLIHFYQSYPGYNLISQCITWPWLSDADNHAFNRLIIEAMDAVTNHMQTRLNELSLRLNQLQEQRHWPETLSALHPSEDTVNNLRVINLSRLNSFEQHCLSRDILAGLTQLGAQCHWQMPDQPDVVSPSAVIQRQVDHDPHLIILIDTLRGHIKGALPEKTIAATIATGRGWQDGVANAAMTGSKDAIFTTTRKQREELIAEGFAGDRVFHLPLAADTRRYHPLEIPQTDNRDFAVDVALIGDRPTTNPEYYKITLPTHQALWNQLISDLLDQPENYSPQDADKLIKRAHRCGVEVRQEDLQKFFRDMLNNVLADAVLPDAYGLALTRAGINLGVWYNAPLRKTSDETRLHYWDESPLADRLRGAIDHDEQRNRLFNTARMVVYIHPQGRVERQLLDAAAAGALVLVRSSRNDRRPDGLCDYFTPNQDIVTFDSPADLVRKVRHYLSHESQRRDIAQKTRQTVLTRHTWQLRMRNMLEQLSQ